MLYLQSIVLDKFKSFRHAELLFSKGFTCIVGPNGSGKSVIFDSLMFGLGEPSLQMMRVDRLDELINRNVRRKHDEPTVAHLKMNFEGDGKKVTVVKSIRSDGKASYRLNDRAMSRKEVIELLSSEGVRVDDTTTIAQGEINAIGKMNSNQRRELIDTAAGISQFEGKKNEALRELDKVDQKISEANVMLKERQGFLSGLEKEKEAAERYLKMNQRVKNLRYSILVSRKESLKSSNDAFSKELSLLDSKKNDSTGRLEELKAKRDKLTEERQQLTKELSTITSTSSETTSKIENLDRELSRLEVEVPSLQKALEEGKVWTVQAEGELKDAKGKVKANAAAVEELNKKIAILERDLAKIGAIPEDGVDYDAELREATAIISESENRLVDLQEYISKLQADLSLTTIRKGEMETQFGGIGKSLELMSDKKKAKEAEVAKIKQEISDMVSTIARLDEEYSRLSRALFDIDNQRLILSEQRAMAQSRESGLAPKIAQRFTEKDGFYGKAYQLCKYDGEHAYAVEVAAGNRLEYFVVDSILVANKIIDYLKKNNMGRATFIPIDDINVDRQSAKEKDITPVIEVVKFDSRFSKVFSYIFNNTYIVDSPNDAKKYGVGRHRYVTLDGELIEQSGIISGGSLKKTMSLFSIENKIKDLEAERDRTKKGADLAEVGLNEAQKQKALLDMQVANLMGELKSISEDTNRAVKQHFDMNNQIKAMAESEAKIRKEIQAKDTEKLDMISSLNTTKQARNEIYDKVSAASKGFAKSKKYKEEKEKSESIRKELETSKMSKASLDTESQMLDRKAAELSAAIAERQKQLKESKAQLADKEMRKEVLVKSRSAIEKEMKGKSESSSKLYDRLNAIDTDVGKLSTEIGRLDSESSNYERQVNELRIRMSQTETRFNDIAAELSAYQTGYELVKGKLEEMEAEANILAAKISELGNVNLKAPEVYEERKRMAEEAQSRIMTLQTEKDAVVKMIEEIDSKKLQTFMDMLNQVNKNFANLYNYVFPGKASIAIEDDTDPLNSGIVIRANDGKSNITVKGLSGGQQSMIALMLLLSIHMCKKSSIYLFDEVDAALDSENAKKLSKLIKQMSAGAQYIVISHNNSLIVNADTAIGVTMDETKESKAIGLEVGSLISNKK